MTDETIDQLNSLVAGYGLYSWRFQRRVAIFGPHADSDCDHIFIECSDLVNPDWQNIENTLVEYILLNGF